ncbi:MAG TPA: phage holin family protein [Chitinophagaceae bacterium]|jgi:putative membrane protein|nr:phage holin family protein [Chitinophagaceae bacterium]
MRFLIRILVIAAVSFGLAHVLSGIHIDTFWTALVFAVVLAILNTFVKPLIVLLTLPVTILTLGLFLFVINALVVLLASRFVDGIRVSGFWWALIFSLILSVVTSILNSEFDKERRRSIL